MNPGLPRDRRGYLPLYYRGFDIYECFLTLSPTNCQAQVHGGAGNAELRRVSPRSEPGAQHTRQERHPTTRHAAVPYQRRVSNIYIFVSYMQHFMLQRSSSTGTREYVIGQRRQSKLIDRFCQLN